MVALLRMFFVEKDIIFLDEPTNDLDYATVEILKSIIHKLSEQKSLLIVTHDERIYSVGGIIYKINNGKIISDRETSNQSFCDVVKKKNEKKLDKLIKNDYIGNFIYALILIVRLIFKIRKLYWINVACI